jgi:Pentapeptide repeats (8 copies)
MQDRRRPWWLWTLAALVGLAALAGIILAVWKLPSSLYGDVSKAGPDARLQAASGFRTALVAGLAGLAALGSLAMATRTYRLTQQGQITERYTKAIEQLGSDKLDVRLGGIYALERIAKDSKRDQPTVVEVLSAFVREHSDPAHTDSEPSIAKVLSTFLQRDNGTSADRQSDAEQPSRRPKPTSDVRAALTVLGRLPSLQDVSRADLSTADFAGANLSRMNLSGFRFTNANLLGAKLKEADLPGANLQGANLQGAELQLANLQGANLWRAELRGAVLWAADLQGAVLGADLQGANLMGAKLQGAVLLGAVLQGAKLHGADLQGAKLHGADLHGAKYDDRTVWPDGFDWKAAEVGLLED